MNTPQVRYFHNSDFRVISGLFPVDWKFDFGKFISLHLEQSYFRAYTITLDSQPVGFGNLMIFGTTAWIGNIVIGEEFRERGLGTILTGGLVKDGEKLGVNTFTLIATKLGEPVYTKLGFRELLRYEFFRPSDSTGTLPFEYKIEDAASRDYDDICQFDTGITGESRDKLLRQFMPGTKLIRDKSGNLQAFYMQNLGNGLILSKDTDAGLELLKFQVNERKNVVINEKNKLAGKFLAGQGYEKYLEAPRMILGKGFDWKPECIFSRGTGYSG